MIDDGIRVVTYRGFSGNLDPFRVSFPASAILVYADKKRNIIYV